MDSPLEVEISDNLSAARCRIYVRKDLKVLLYYILMNVYFLFFLENLFSRQN